MRNAGFDPSSAPDAHRLATAFRASAKFRRVLEACAELLRLPAEADADALRDRLLRQEPALAAHVALAEICVAALPAVLQGSLPATEVLFPGGTLQRVGPIYRDNPWADYFNQLSAEACLQAIQARRARRPGQATRILEIGAGTGSTTGFVLERLSGQHGAFDYVYTDLSLGFVQHGRQVFGERGHSMEFRQLDIEQGLSASSPLQGSAHIVIATNVLHATRRIDASLAHVRALMADDGLLLLSELTRMDAFATLTFGLLDGWWRFEDGARRLPHGPILSVAGWREALAETGFGAPAVYGWNGREDGFQCLFVCAAEAATATVQPKSVEALRPAARHQLSPTGELPLSMHSAGLAPPLRVDGGWRQQLRSVLAKRLGFGNEEIGWDHPFAELGVDSIVAPQFAADLTEALSLPVDAVDIYNYGSIAMLADALMARRPVRAVESPEGHALGSPTVPAPPGDAIAIIGLACRFAGASDAEAYWRLLEEGRDATAPVGNERWPGTGLAMTAGLLPDADCFDPDFFRLSHAEAEVMDPQQRVFLEECWHALEDAGLGPRHLDGHSCGVFVGVAAQYHPANRGDARAALGNSNAILAARIAYHLNLKGPAVPVDTACSSSLVAIHLAAQAIRSGDCDLALAGGVSVLLCNASLPRFLVEAGMVSPTGQCRAFDAAADGFVPGEGVGVVVLRRLDRALAQGDRILGVILASGINQDGRTSGITAPNGPAQTALLQRVWECAHIDPATLSLIEAHGTGTPLGDPIEVQALTAAFAERPMRQPCALGSVKPNIGHTLTAAGVASVAKVLLALRHRTIPPSLHCQTPNPRLRLDTAPFYVPGMAEAWRKIGPRRAAISSFGFSGTNAHMVLEEAPVIGAAVPSPAFPSVLVLLSAANLPALERLAMRLADWLQAHPATGLGDLCRTLNAGRAFLSERAAFQVSDTEALLRGLRALAEGRLDPSLIRRIDSREAPGGEWRISPNDDLHQLARHFVAGSMADWERLGSGGRVLSLPGYPFARDRFPLPSDEVGDRIEALDAILPAGDPAFLDHRWDGRAIFPASAFLLLAARAIGPVPCMVNAVIWHKPLTAGNRSARLRLSAQGHLELASNEGIHAEAAVRVALPEETPNRSAPAETLSQGMGHAEVYRRFASMGFEYGPAFRVIQDISVVGSRVLARLDWPTQTQCGRIPEIGLLDGVIQSALGLLGTDGQPETVVPIGLERAWMKSSCLTAPLLVEIRENLAIRRSGRRSLELLAWNAAGQVAAHLDGLAVSVLETADPVVPLLYRPVWRQAETLPRYAAPSHDTSVLLFDHTDRHLALLGPKTILVQPGERYRELARLRYELPPGDPAALAALAHALAGQGLHPDIWLNLWPWTETDAADVRLAFGPLTLLHGLHAWLPQRDRSRRLRVLQASHAGQLQDADSDPAFAATAALLQSLTAEEPRFLGKAIALPTAAGILPRLFSELAEQGGSTEIVLDAQGQRHVRAYAALPGESDSSGLPEGAVCLITGGLGGLGLALARHLWQSRKASLALLGRTPGKAQAEREIAELRSAGARIVEVNVDIADISALRKALAGVEEQLGSVQAVFHLAGVQADGFLRGLDTASVSAVLAAKITGTQALLDVFAERPVPVVAFASLSGAFGAAGQAPYAVANRAMAALLEQEARLRTDRRILSLDWGYWEPSALVGGMAARHGDAVSVSAATGLVPFLPEQGMEMLDSVLAAPLAGRLLLTRGRRAAFESFMAGGNPSPPETLGTIAPLAADSETFLAYLTGIVAEITHTPRERLGADRAIDEFGIDSIMITRLNARLERDLGRISKTLFFEHSNLRTLALHLARHHGTPLPAAGAEGKPSRQAERADAGVIAVIGMAGRFPEAVDIGAYWRNLIAGRVCISEIPLERWPLEGFYDPDPNRAGTSYSKWGGFIDGIDRFDPLFFNIAPDEAARMDPQERLFLEVAWQCLEDAGLTRAALGPVGERDTGVYVGVMYGDYQLLAHEAAGSNAPLGGASPYWSIANRASYALGLEGPSLAVDSACSSSLTALHLACQAIAVGDCRTALVGGVNLSLHPGKYIGLSQGRFAASDGRCHSFGSAGDGYVPGEGVAAVLLKPLSTALADGDVIHGILRASAVNHGGRTNGYTVPNPAAQAAVIRRALNRSGLKGGELGYIEAHGTGTRLGDPIEIEGLAQALGAETPQGAIPLGSAKAAIGHLEAAAGLAGLIKVLLQMRCGRYAAMPLSGPPNPDIDFAATPFRLQTESAVWPPGPDGKRYAGVSSFGAGGANAHVIVQEAPQRNLTEDDGKARVIPLSSRTQAQVRALAGVLAEHLTDPCNPVTLADLCHTLTAGREALRWRCAFVAADRGQVQAMLAAIASSRDGQAVLWGEAPDDSGVAPDRPASDGLAALAQFWCQGGAALWPHLGVRLSLAARPFLGTRHWLRTTPPVADAGRSAAAPVADWTRAARPLQNGESAAWTFTIQPDSTLLSHHRVGGECLLPGAAIVAMALELDHTGIRELTWIRPVRAGTGPLRLDFSLRHTATGRVFSVRESGSEDASLLATGSLAAAAAAALPTLAIPSGGKAIETGNFYRRLKELGLDYGERFRVVRRLWPDAKLACAELAPTGMADAAFIDPALLDAAFQSLAGLLGDLDGAVRGDAVPLPHTLASVAVLGDPKQARLAYAKRLSGPDEPVQRFDLTMTDSAGNAVLLVGGLTARRRAIAEPEVPITLLRPVWSHRPGTIIKPGRTVILAASGAEALAEDLAGRFADVRIFPAERTGLENWSVGAETLYYLDTADGVSPPPAGKPTVWAEAAASRCLRLLAWLRALGLQPGASIRRALIVTRGVYAIHASEGLDQMSDAAGLHGLAKVAAREMPGLAVVAVDLPVAVNSRALDLLAEESGDAAGAEVAYRHGRRFARRLQALASSSANSLPLLPGDSCLIVGGAGGVGGALAEHWARSLGARIALVGRRPADAAIRGLVARLKALGGDGLYIQADATDPVALTAAVEQAQDAFGPISLAVHGALSLRDKTLALMDESDFRTAFAPRAKVGAAFIAAFANRPVQGLLLLSSANLFLGQHGQGNYVAGNAALAALGHAARAQGLPVSLVHWGLWGEVGAVADPATQARFSAEGVLPISPAAGAAILPKVLAAGFDVAAVRVSSERLAQIGWLETTPPRRQAMERPAFLTGKALAALLSQTAPLDGNIASAQSAFLALEQFGLLRVAGILLEMAGAAASKRLTPARLLKEMGVAPAYERLAKTLLRRLAEAGWVEQRDELWRLHSHRELDRLLGEQQAVLAELERECPWLSANRLLLETCLEAYPAVLRGQRPAAAVLFPNGDSALVAVAYQGNPVSDRANALLGVTVAAEVEARLRTAPGPLRILEAGAGTGGSTLPLLAKLKPWRDKIQYRATDLSPYLAKSLQDRCLAEGWQIEAGALDIGREPGLAERSSYHIILAANVVHATPDIATSLRNLKTLLLPGGRLVLNELTACRDLGTMVFGLTPQWWAADDHDSRLPDGPAVAAAVWLDLLAENGFTDPLLEGVEGDPDVSSLSLITALADGFEPVAETNAASVASAPPPAAMVAASSEPSRHAMLDYLKNVFSAVLGIDAADLRSGDTFERYGVESLSALEIRNRIAVDYPGVGSTLLFEHNTLQRLAEHLLAARHPDYADTVSNTGPILPSGLRASFDDPIAVIGYAGRFPGADTAEALWSLLREGRSALGPVPAGRWDHAQYVDRAAQGVPAPGHCRSRWGGFINDIDLFDPLFFGITPLEADSMDPQERLFIETCWSALEDAGTTPSRLAGQARAGNATGSVGVFCGVMNTAYQWLAAEAWRSGDDQAASSHFWSIPNRVSYLFDFDGPSIALDTACSSSLTALHLACESLRRGECGAALAGGVNLIAHPRQLVNLAQAGMTAAGAECRVFAADADGFVDGEGVGVAVLKLLSRALADGDRIDGLIVGSAINAGGKTGGFTVPNPRAQSAVIRAALERAGIDGEGLCMVETHGTGTELGDPIEVAGLMAGLARPLSANRLPLGTLKANIGHLESAAGIASLIKVLLQLRHATIAPARHAATPNPLIRWQDTPFRLPAEQEAWIKPANRPRRAAISGFGAGGANAHLIIQEAPASPRQAVPMSPEVIPLSVRNPHLLPKLAGQMADAIAAAASQPAGLDSQTLLADIGRTLRLGRAEQAHCAWIEAHDLAELLEALRRLARGEPVPTPSKLAARSEGDPRARPISLPSTPFARQRHWLNVEPAPPGGVPAHSSPAVAVSAKTADTTKDTARLEKDKPKNHAAVSTRLLALRWVRTPRPVLSVAPLDILLIGGEEALAVALSGLGHRVERLLPAGPWPELSRTQEAEQCVVIVETRGSDSNAGDTLRAALDIARHLAKSAGTLRILHVAPFHPDGEPLPASFAIAALLRSLAAETVRCRGGCLTLATPAEAISASAIAEELAALSQQGTRQIQRRGHERLQLEIAPRPFGQGTPRLAFREGGSYVLVGGLGEVGKPLAQALLRRYRARIALLGRSLADSRTPALLESIGEPGQVGYWSCDIGDQSALAAVLADIRQTLGSIDGVLHLARHVDPAPLHSMQPETAAATLSPKVEGSLNLIQALTAHKIDWLVFFSSLAAWAGQAGGADYAAACGFQDGLALAGKAYPLLSVAWPQWEHDRFLDSAKRELWSSLDLATLDAEAGLDALENLLWQGGGAYGVLRGLEAASASLLSRLRGTEPAWAAQLAGLDVATLRAYRDYLRERLAPENPPQLESQAGATLVPANQAPPAPASCAEAVLDICSEYLKIPPDILARSSFAELGLDSMRALHLAERLQRRLQRPVEPVMLFENPSVERLAQALTEMQEAS